MRKNILLFVLAIITGTTFAQKASDNAIRELCGCVKQIDPKLTEDQQSDKAVLCMTNTMAKYQAALKKEFNITSNDMQEVMQEISMNMGMPLISGCPEVMPYLMKYAQRQQETIVKDATYINPDTLKLDKKVCTAFTSGKYQYEEVYIENVSTVSPYENFYSELKDGLLLDYYENGKYTSKWSVKWINNCEWEQVLIETNEPKLKSTMNKGDKLVFKAVGSSPNSDLWVASKISGFDVLVRLRKIR